MASTAQAHHLVYIPALPAAVHCQKLFQHWLAPVAASGLRTQVFNLPMHGTETYRPAAHASQTDQMDDNIDNTAKVVVLLAMPWVRHSPAAKAAAAARRSRMLVHHVTLPQHVLHPQ